MTRAVQISILSACLRTGRPVTLWPDANLRLVLGDRRHDRTWIRGLEIIRDQAPQPYNERAEGIRDSHCVPTVLQMILGEWIRRGAQAGGLKRWTVMIGGSALLPPLQHAAQEAGIDLLTGYGMSETGPVVALARGEDPDDAARLGDLRKAGRPLPLVRAAIVDADMTIQPFDGTSQGELVLRAPWLTASYPGDSQASVDLWRGGWMHTQDVATISADGTIEIRDRLKDVIKSGGEWISSIEIETVLLEHPVVAEAAVVATPDPLWGERAAAFIVLIGGAEEDNATQVIKDFFTQTAATGRISRFAVPTEIIFVAELPRTSVGKIDKKTLRSTRQSAVMAGRKVQV